MRLFLMSYLLGSALVSQVSMAAGTVALTCLNEADSQITFSAQVSPDASVLRFGRASDGSETDDAVSGRRATLQAVRLDSKDYLHFEGRIVTSRELRLVRKLEVSIAKSELNKTTGIKLSLGISNEFDADSSSYLIYGHGMICRKRQ